MKQGSVTELKNKLSEYLRLLKRYRAGVITRARGKPGKLKKEPIPCRADVVQALIEERGRD